MATSKKPNIKIGTWYKMRVGAIHAEEYGVVYDPFNDKRDPSEKHSPDEDILLHFPNEKNFFDSHWFSKSYLSRNARMVDEGEAELFYMTR